MKPAESFVAQPVRSLQTMLRTIAQVEPNQPSLIPDGIYGPETTTAVSAFQRRYGLPVTGVTDNATWDAIVNRYGKARIETEPAQPVQITLDPLQVIRRGESSPYMFLIQSMLILLADLYKDFPQARHTGTLDEDTRRAIEALQIYSELSPTGEIDKTTWKHLALQYALAADWLQNLTKL